jgi:REP element-mobilizing transposase RayT
MPRRLRVSSGGYAYHVLNRAVGRLRIFAKERDFEAFEEVIGQAKTRLPMRLLGWAVLSNHWHFGLWPRGDGDLSEFMRWLQHVQTPQTEAEVAALRRSVVRGSPFGEASWQDRTAKRLGLQSTRFALAVVHANHNQPRNRDPFTFL